MADIQRELNSTYSVHPISMS